MMSPNDTPLDCDVIHDAPGVLTIATLIYPTHTDCEVTVYEGAELEDLATIYELLPISAARIATELVISEGSKALVTTYRVAEVITQAV